MDLNGDGNLDILSGSYSRQDRDMAGLFQVLWGKPDGSFGKAQVLDGSDGQPLLLPKSENVTDRICTRPFAVDLDGDGNLDLVAGNFTGTFAWFRGEGKGKFAPTSTWLEQDGAPLRTDGHGDPFFVDWDQDGDFDLFSGSSQGGVFYFANEGSKTAPKFGKRITVLKAHGHAMPGPDAKFGDAHLTGPSADTRVWVADVDKDGKLDLLVGDQIVLLHVAAGVTEDEARTKFAAWNKKQEALFKEQAKRAEQEAEAEKGEKGEQKAIEITASSDFQERYEALQKERDAFLVQESTGFVWLLRGK